MLEVRERWTKKDIDGLTGRLPALDPAVDIGRLHEGPICDAKRAGMTQNLRGGRRIALDQRDRGSSSADGLEADDSRAGEEIDERMFGDVGAQDAKQSLTQHVW